MRRHLLASSYSGTHLAAAAAVALCVGFVAGLRFDRPAAAAVVAHAAPAAGAAPRPAAPPRRLMIVAHPDDETIFGGSFLLSAPGWLVVCVTCASRVNAADSAARTAEFEAAMRDAGAQTEVWDVPDVGIAWGGAAAATGRPQRRRQGGDEAWKTPWNATVVADVARRVRRLLAAHAFEEVLTHGRAGEYGHPQHKQVHRVLARACPPNLRAFHRGDAHLPLAAVARVYRLAAHYASQEGVVQWLADYVLHQDAVRVPCATRPRPHKALLRRQA